MCNGVWRYISNAREISPRPQIYKHTIQPRSILIVFSVVVYNIAFNRMHPLLPRSPPTRVPPPACSQLFSCYSYIYTRLGVYILCRADDSRQIRISVATRSIPEYHTKFCPQPWFKQDGKHPVSRCTQLCNVHAFRNHGMYTQRSESGSWNIHWTFWLYAHIPLLSQSQNSNEHWTAIKDGCWERQTSGSEATLRNGGAGHTRFGKLPRLL